jgi:transposase
MSGDLLLKQKMTFYGVEFKVSAVKLALGSAQPVSQIARELGVNENTLHTWISNYSKPKDNGMGSTEPIYEENKRLKQELARVTQERDLLKKAAAYFAKEFR